MLHSSFTHVAYASKSLAANARFERVALSVQVCAYKQSSFLQFITTECGFFALRYIALTLLVNISVS